MDRLSGASNMALWQDIVVLGLLLAAVSCLVLRLWRTADAGSGRLCSRCRGCYDPPAGGDGCKDGENSVR